MKIDDLLERKGLETEAYAGGVKVPVRALESLREAGYEQIRPYGSEKTVSAWGKACSGCFTMDQLHRMAR